MLALAVGAYTATFSSHMSDSIPNPGSDEAIEQGCKCAVLDNNHGDGYMGTDRFVVTATCPLHGHDTEWSTGDTARSE